MSAVAKIAESAPVMPMENIHARMVAVMRDIGAIGKDKNNAAQGFKYRGIDDVYNAINPIFSKHGVFMSATILDKSREERTNAKGTVLAFTCLRMRYRFTGEDGSFVETEAEGEGMDSGDKSSNKAMAVAHKYALLQTFCIPTQDLDDPDAHVHEVTGLPKRADTSPAQDEDVKAGALNWIEKQEARILAFTDVEQMNTWLSKCASLNGRPGNWDRPTPGSDLDKMLKHFPDLFRRLKAFYMEKLREV